MIILIDMDNTLIDFDRGLLTAWQKLYPSEFYVPLEKRQSFHPHEDYPAHLQEKIYQLCHSKGFIRNLPPTPQGIKAVNRMIVEGHDIRFCTSHLFEYRYCLFEKYEWIEKYFGKEYVDRIILTRDKTLIRGDILIDDKPNITGIATPTWEHILYDRPHNRNITGKRRLTWNNWYDVLFPDQP